MTTSVQVRPLSIVSLKNLFFASLFVAGNIALPQLCHMAGLSGQQLLPIMFFTLIAAARYGITAGLITAILSPLVNNLLFGMPALDMMWVLMIKSSVMALVLGVAAQKAGRITIWSLAASIVSYQTVGLVAQGAIMGDFTVAVNSVTMAWAGMLIQLIGGWIALRLMAQKN